MLMALSVPVGLLAGLLCGGRFSNFAKSPICELWLAVIAFLSKAFVPYLCGLVGAQEAGPLLVCFLHYGILLIFIYLNRGTGVWAPVFGAGTALNFLVIASNGGAMPVSAAALSHAGSAAAARLAAGEIFAYAPVDAGTRLAFLGDVLTVAPFGTVWGFASAGDVFLALGVGLLCFALVRGTLRPPRPALLLQRQKP